MWGERGLVRAQIAEQGGRYLTYPKQPTRKLHMKISLRSASSLENSENATVGIYRDGLHIATVEVHVEQCGEQSIKLHRHVSGLNHCSQAGIIKAASDFIDAEFSGAEQVAEVEV